MKVVIHKWFAADNDDEYPPGIYDTKKLPLDVAIDALVVNMRERANGPDHNIAIADCTPILIDALRLLARDVGYDDEVEALIEAHERIIRS